MTTLPLDLATWAGLSPIPDDAVTHGEVFTRQWVVETLLDLVDWRPDLDLTQRSLVEPACGAGAFLKVIAQRLSESCRKFDRPLTDAANCVRAFDVLPTNVTASRAAVTATLLDEGWAQEDVTAIAEAWIQQGDYLLTRPPDQDVDVVVGNPPYIRLEDLPEDRMKVYRSLWPTMIGRADVYVGFIEAGLRSLRAGGRLAFICSDRWMRNQYGRALRAMVAERFAVDTVIGLHDVDAFEESVSAYPAIIVLRRGPQSDMVMADTTTAFTADDATALVDWVRDGQGTRASGTGWEAARIASWRPGAQSWPSASPPVAAALAELSERFPALGGSDSGVRVGIGVATGADQVYITRDRGLVEEDRLLPLALARDTTTGQFTWSGHYLVNPWGRDGQLVSL